MKELKITNELNQRLDRFVKSSFFSLKNSDVAKSDYWKYQSTKLISKPAKDSIATAGDGDAGYYIPDDANYFKRIFRKTLNAIKYPDRGLDWLRRKIAELILLKTPHLMNDRDAFDSVMNSKEVSFPILSPLLINHAELLKKENIFANSASVSKHYRKWSGYNPSNSIFNQYYYLNLLNGYLEKNDIKTIVEIGPGNGNFPTILYQNWKKVKIILIDLPESLSISIPFICSLFPDAKVYLPNEIDQKGLPKDFDFAFLTVDQLDFVKDDSIDLALNFDSFQEMTHEQIKIYFNFIQRVCRDSGYFFTSNRVEKIPYGENPFTEEQSSLLNRFSEFPWNKKNEIIIYEISRFTRLIQLDSAYLRLERIHKK